MSEEDFKGATHAAAASLFAVMAAYNLMKFCATRERRNAVNVALYLPLTVWEWRQARYHWRSA